MLFHKYPLQKKYFQKGITAFILKRKRLRGRKISFERHHIKRRGFNAINKFGLPSLSNNRHKNAKTYDVYIVCCKAHHTPCEIKFPHLSDGNWLVVTPCVSSLYARKLLHQKCYIQITLKKLMYRFLFQHS